MQRGDIGRPPAGSDPSPQSDHDLFIREPWRWIDLARQVAVDDVHPAPALERLLAEVPSPRHVNSDEAAEAFWGLLSHPYRDRGLRWLDRLGLLEELFPCWRGSLSWRTRRLDAVEQVHLESWSRDLSERAIRAIGEVHNPLIDGALSGWALTALATLFADEDAGDHLTWTESVGRDLRAFGARDAAVIWVLEILDQFHPAMGYLQGVKNGIQLPPQLAVVALSSLTARSDIAADVLAIAARRADDAMLK